MKWKMREEQRYLATAAKFRSRMHFALMVLTGILTIVYVLTDDAYDYKVITLLVMLIVGNWWLAGAYNLMLKKIRKGERTDVPWKPPQWM